jgi:hypothetical protein
MKIMMRAVLPISLGLCAVLLASACSSSLPRGTSPPRVADPKSSGASAPTTAATLDRSQIDVDNDMRKRGYKPMIYRGERVYCRNEALTGSNLESKVCLTAKQIEDQERSGKDVLKDRNRQAVCAPMQTGCN